MDKLRITRDKRVGIRTPKNDKAHVQNGLGNQQLVAADYTSTKPKKLSTARLSAYWVAFVGGEVRNV